jgi:hypothetical protein
MWVEIVSRVIDSNAQKFGSLSEVKNYKKNCKKFVNISREVFSGFLWVVFHPFKIQFSNTFKKTIETSKRPLSDSKSPNGVWKLF